MLILSWNVNHWNQETDLPAKTKAIGSVKPDIVTLQEVRSDLANAWAEQLAESELVHAYWSGKAIATEPYYQCLIASRWRVTPVDDRWRFCAPYPELLGRATVSVSEKEEVDVFTAHIPNGKRNGWKKIDTFHVLSAELLQANDSPRILTGDFNEPKLFQESGKIVTFSEELHGDCGRSKETWPDDCGDDRPRVEWTNGVLSVLGGVSHHGLRDAYRDRHGIQKDTLVTFCKGANKKCFDHTFVSRHFEVLDCGYYHKWRHQLKLSDHSPMWGKLRLRTDQAQRNGFVKSFLKKLLRRTLPLTARR